jgi:hypothetical protein
MSTISASTTTTTAYVVTADTTGALVLQTGATPTTALTISSAQVVTLAKDAVVNGLTVGKGGGAVSTNTAVGASALGGGSQSGGTNAAFGNNVLAANTSGGSNTAMGYYTLASNTTGGYNVAIGGNSSNPALYSNTTGSYNTALGSAALQANTTASNNTAVGYQAAYASTGAGITAIGSQVLKANTTGSGNTGVGGYHDGIYESALYANTTGVRNAALGAGALSYNTTGSYNVGLGIAALYNNTSASNNTAVGHLAGYTNQTGAYNTFVGKQAGYTCTGGDNTFIGFYAGALVTTGTYNTFVGDGSGEAITTGGKNTIIGKYSGNQGGLDIRTASNRIVLSDGDGNPCIYNDKTTTTLNNPSGRYTILDFNNACVNKAELYWDNTSLQFYVAAGVNGVYLNNGGNSWNSVSDERKKDIIEPITNAVNKVSTLRAVIGKYKTDEEGTRRSFLIAQDVQAVLPEAVSETESKEGLFLGMSYTDVMPLLVAAIKELKTIVDAQATEITALKAKVGI